MLSGLTGQGKMSKSDPNSAIYMEDEEVCLLEIQYFILFINKLALPTELTFLCFVGASYQRRMSI